MNKATLKKQDWVFIALLCGIGLSLLVWKAHHGFPSWDESTYLSLIYRFYLGDLPIIEEWHPTQFSAIAQLPLLSLYIKLQGSNEVMVLFYRYVFIGMQVLVTVLLYTRIRSYGWISIPIAMIYYLFSYNQLVSTQYTNVSFACMLSFAVLLCFPSKHEKRDAYLAGIVYAFATLCTPYLVLPYIVGSIYIIYLKITKRPKHPYLQRQCPYITYGIFTIVLIYVIYFLTKAPLQQYITYLPNVLRNQDHGGGVLQWIINTLALGKMIWVENTITLILVPVFFGIYVYMLWDKKKEAHRDIYWTICLILSMALMLAYRNVKTNYAMLLYVPLGLFAMALYPRQEKRLVYMFWIGIVYVLMINISSNTIINASRCACVVCMVPSILMVAKSLTKTQLRGLLYGLLAVMLAIETYDKVEKFDVDSNDTRSDSVVLLQEGALKGIYTTASQADNYITSVHTFHDLLTNDTDNVLLLDFDTWLYLELQKPDEYSTHTVWLKPNRSDEMEFITQYFDAFPENAPDTIWIDSDYDYYAEYFRDGQRVFVEGN